MNRTKCRMTVFSSVIVFLIATVAQGAVPLRYFVGQEVIVVQVVSTVKKSRAIETLKGTERSRCTVRHAGSADPELCVTETDVTTREGTVMTKLVPDPRLSADISVAGKAFTDDEMTIELRDGMLLQNINLKSTGRAGEAIASIAKFAGFLAGVPGLWAKTTPDQGVAHATSTCNPFTRPLADQPDTVRLWLWENQEQCDSWQEIRKLQKARDALVDDRLALEHDIRGATNNELRLLLGKLKGVEDALKKAEADLKPRQENFSTQLERFIADLRLGLTTTSQVHDQVLNIQELPPPTNLSAGLSESQTSQVVSQGFGDSAKTLWQQARLIVTFDPVVPTTCSTAPSVPDNGVPMDKDVVNIFFRQGAPARMRAFIADQTSDAANSTLRVVGDRFDNYIHGCLPVSAMTFKRSSWSSRELSLTFDERGRPVKLVRTSKSDGAAIAAALSVAATSFRDEMATTVAKVVDVQANRRKIEMDSITRRLEQAKGEKEILDAQRALDAAGSNFDAALKQKQATANLELIKAELALATAQSTAEQTQQIEALKIAVAQINHEIELIKAQQALEKAKQ